MEAGNVRPKTKTLSLCEKLQLIEDHEEKKHSARKLAVIYGVGKTQVYETLKNKLKIRDELLKGTSGQRKRLAYVSLYEDVNNATWEWLLKRMAEGLSTCGPMIQAHALKVAQSLGKTDFRASNGWLESFRARRNIVCYTGSQVLVGAKDVIVRIEEDRIKQSIVKYAEGYWEENIFVAYETCLCYKMLPTSGDCTEKLGVLLCANMKGMLLKPLVVGKIARPKAFGKLDAATLPVHWRPSSHACMTNFVVEEWLRSFDVMMRMEDRNVILYLNNVSCSPPVTLPNVKIVRCSELLDQGLVFHFKCIYRKYLLQTILLKLESSVVKLEPGAVNLGAGVGEVCTSITVLDAVNWISRAVSNIPPDLVRQSFVKSGFKPVDEFVMNDDAERSMCAEISQLCRGLNLDPGDVMRFDDSIPEDPLQIKEELDEPVQEEEEETINIETYSVALKAVNDLEKFAAQKNCPQLLSALQDTKDALSKSCQSSLP